MPQSAQFSIYNTSISTSRSEFHVTSCSTLQLPECLPAPTRYWVSGRVLLPKHDFVTAPPGHHGPPPKINQLSANNTRQVPCFLYQSVEVKCFGHFKGLFILVPSSFSFFLHTYVHVPLIYTYFLAYFELESCLAIRSRRWPHSFYLKTTFWLVYFRPFPLLQSMQRELQIFPFLPTSLPAQQGLLLHSHHFSSVLLRHA